MSLQLMQVIEPQIEKFQFAPVNRPRLARYLELPSIAELDEITDAEIRMLDERRAELLLFWQCSTAFAIDCIAGRWIKLDCELAPIEATAAYGQHLLKSGAGSLVIAAFTLGAKVDEMIKNHLNREEVYEAFVLKQWAAAMAEQARVRVTKSLDDWAKDHGCSLLPYDGPGYNGWPLAALNPLLEMLYGAGEPQVTQPIRATESGVLLPTNSMLIVFGVTPRRPAGVGNESLAQCHRCAMRNCRYRMTEAAKVVCSG
jgi:hypothetical protein